MIAPAATTARGMWDPELGFLIAEPLMMRSKDEPFSMYGLLAETVEWDDARTYIQFNLNPKAKWSDGKPVTPDDVIFTFELLRDKPELREKLWHNVRLLQGGLKERGFDIGDTNTCVTPVYMHGEVEEAMALVKDMRDNYSVFCSIVVYPVIPKGMIILRLIPTADHTEEDIQITLDAFTAVREKMQAGVYKQFIPEVLV